MVKHVVLGGASAEFTHSEKSHEQKILAVDTKRTRVIVVRYKSGRNEAVKLLLKTRRYVEATEHGIRPTQVREFHGWKELQFRLRFVAFRVKFTSVLQP